MLPLREVGLNNTEILASQISSVLFACFCLLFSYFMYNQYMNSRNLANLWGFSCVFFLLLFVSCILSTVNFNYPLYNHLTAVRFGLVCAGFGIIYYSRKLFKYFEDQERLVDKLMQRETQVKTLIAKSLLEHKNVTGETSEWFLQQQLNLKQIESVLNGGH